MSETPPVRQRRGIRDPGTPGSSVRSPIIPEGGSESDRLSPVDSHYDGRQVSRTYSLVASSRSPTSQAVYRPGRARYTESTKFAWIVASVLFVAALGLRFYKIGHPDQVVYVFIPFIVSSTTEHVVPPVSTRSTLASSPRSTS